MPLQILLVKKFTTLYVLEKDVFSSCHECGTKKKKKSAHEELKLRHLDSVLRYSTTESQRLRGG